MTSLSISRLLFALSVTIISCVYHLKPTQKEKANVYLYINKYLSKVSSHSEYKELKEAFSCYYSNAVKFKRENYLLSDSLLGEAFFGLDSLIIFNRSLDSALLFYVEKHRNSSNDGFYYDAVKIFAYKTFKGWRFYDGCGSAMYGDKVYTLEMARNNERLWFAFDGEWLKNWDTDYIKENPGFIRHACESWCGPCADKRDSLNMDIYYDDIRKHIPPDSLYQCK